MSTGEMMWHVPWKNAITLLRAIPTVAFQCIYFYKIFWHIFGDILFAILFDILSDILRNSVWHLRNWGPAVPTDIWLLPLRSGRPTEIWLSLLSSSLRSGSAHWHLALAVEARECPLRSGAVEVRGRRRQAAPLIKSRDSHLACMAMHSAKKCSSTNQTEAYIIPYYTQYWLTYSGFLKWGYPWLPQIIKN